MLGCAAVPHTSSSSHHLFHEEPSIVFYRSFNPQRSPRVPCPNFTSSRLSCRLRGRSFRSHSFSVCSWANSKSGNFGSKTEGQFQPSPKKIPVAILLAEWLRGVLYCRVNA